MCPTTTPSRSSSPPRGSDYGFRAPTISALTADPTNWFGCYVPGVPPPPSHRPAGKPGRMTTAERAYEIHEHKSAVDGRRVLAADRTDQGWFNIALAGLRPDCDHPGRWMVMLGYDLAKAIGDTSHPAFDVRDESEARQWLDLLARIYLADPPAGTAAAKTESSLS